MGGGRESAAERQKRNYFWRGVPRDYNRELASRPDAKTCTLAHLRAKETSPDEQNNKIHSRRITTTLLLAPLAALRAANAPKPAGKPVRGCKPNIVFILADDAGIGDFSCYGCTYGATPNIDRLAKEGMLFTQAYSGNAVCCPSRCVLMTGLHPGHALFRANDSCRPTAASRDGVLSLPANQVTIARVLHDAGYATGGFGKWGLGNPGTTGAAEKEGFDQFFGYVTSHSCDGNCYCASGVYRL